MSACRCPGQCKGQLSGLDEWGWEQLRPWLGARADLPVGPLFASSTVTPAGDRGGAPRFAPSFAGSPHAQASGAGSRRTSCAMRTRSARPGEHPAQHHPAPTRARQPRYDVDLPARNRPRGDHRRRPYTPRPDDVGQRRAATLSHRVPGRERPALPPTPDCLYRGHHVYLRFLRTHLEAPWKRQTAAERSSYLWSIARRAD
jgi:hypothetical protein